MMSCIETEREFLPDEQARVRGRWASSPAQGSYWNAVYRGWEEGTLQIHALNPEEMTGLSKGGVVLNLLSLQ